MPTLTVMRGLPGSGKTTYARTWVAEDRATRIRVNRDDLRTMIDDSVYVEGVTEPRIVEARNALILAFLLSGFDVICDETNLSQSSADELAEIANGAQADMAVVDLTSVPLETCIARDARRIGRSHIGGYVIRLMHDEHLAPT